MVAPGSPVDEARRQIVERGGSGKRHDNRGAEGRDSSRAQEPAEVAFDMRRHVTTTPELIDALAANLTPVQRLRHPLVRAAGWLLLAASILVLLAVSQGLRPDLPQRLQQPTFVVAMSTSLLTGVLAAIASFLICLPDRSRLWGLLPAPAAVLWVSTIGYGCIIGWIGLGPDGVRLTEVVRCFATLVLTSTPLSIAMLVMLRRAVPLFPRSTAISGGLAVAAVTAFALSLFHNLDASVMVLFWNLGVAALVVGMSGTFGRRALARIRPR